MYIYLYNHTVIDIVVCSYKGDKKTLVQKEKNLLEVGIGDEKTPVEEEKNLS